MFTFDDAKFLSPYIVTYDADKNVMLKKCIVTFMQDAYDIITVTYKYECKYLSIAHHISVCFIHVYICV